MLSLGPLFKVLGPLLFQGIEVYKNWKDKRVIQDLERKIRSLRILVGILLIILLLMLVWILWH